jgi:uncharacterized protein (DUF427 family)
VNDYPVMIATANRVEPVPRRIRAILAGETVLDTIRALYEQVFVHPRNPYVRVDALRSTRHARVAIDGAVLAESASPVMVIETGLPTRSYFNRTHVNFDHLVPTDTVTACPYKGTTTGYWSVQVGETIHRDLAWTYDFPTREVSPIAGLISFYNERADMFVDGQKLDRPITHFFPSTD